MSDDNIISIVPKKDKEGKSETKLKAKQVHIIWDTMEEEVVDCIHFETNMMTGMIDFYVSHDTDHARLVRTVNLKFIRSFEIVFVDELGEDINE